MSAASIARQVRKALAIAHEDGTIVKRKSFTDRVHVLYTDGSRITACGLYAFSRMTRSIEHWPRTDDRITCKNCLRILRSCRIPDSQIAHQVVNQFDNPASNDLNDACIFIKKEDADYFLNGHLVEELGSPKKNFRIRKVKITYLEE